MRAALIFCVMTCALPACALDERPEPRPVTKVVTKTVVRTVYPVCPRKTACKEMTSCAEAVYQLTTCHQYQLDRNDNHIPCERQWCGTSTEEMEKRIRENPYRPPTPSTSS
jgi:hypothetical protein